jgi:hypothetical protein
MDRVEHGTNGVRNLVVEGTPIRQFATKHLGLPALNEGESQ